jgi:hypothetical protein
MKTLFIGGQEDGKWIDIPEDVQIWRVEEEPTVDFNIGTMPYMDEFKIFTYRRVRILNENDHEYSIMVSDDINCVLESLLNGYMKGK